MVAIIITVIICITLFLCCLLVTSALVTLEKEKRQTKTTLIKLVHEQTKKAEPKEKPIEQKDMKPADSVNDLKKQKTWDLATIAKFSSDLSKDLSLFDEED